MKFLIKVTTILISFNLQLAQGDYKIKRWESDLDWLKQPNISLVKGFSNLNFDRQAVRDDQPKSGFNIPESKLIDVFRWEELDFNNRNWFTQGTAGSLHFVPGKHILIVSWYATNEVEYKGSRLTFIDMETLKYRHVLLVENVNSVNHSSQKYKALPIHAGGITTVGNLIYVTSGSQGIRVFDIQKIFETEADPSQKKIGIHKGKAYAFNYRYAIPQVAHYKLSQLDMKFSSLSLEIDSIGNRFLWSASFENNYIKEPRVISLKLNDQGWITSFGQEIYPKDKNGIPVYKAQGVFRHNDRTFITRTGAGQYKRSHSRLVRHQDGDKKGKRWRWPRLTEDLYFDQTNSALWCNTEKPGERYVFSVDLRKYQ